MRFYNNQIPFDNKDKIEAEKFKKVKEPSSVGQFIILLGLIFLLLMLSNFVLKPLFGHYPRTKYSFVEYSLWHLILAVVLTIILRPLVKSCLLPEGPFSENMAFYYKLPLPAIQVNYLGELSKQRIIFTSITIFLFFSVVSLLLMKIRGFYYLFEIFLYLNAILSSYGFYNILLVLKEPKDRKFIEYGMTLYSK